MQPLLSSLSLQQPNKKRTKFYSTSLENQSKIESLSLIATVGPLQSYHSDHNVVRTAWGHTGCVNTMHWEETGGEGRLASAGDDTKICIWKPGLERRTNSSERESFVSQPGLDLGLSAVIDTGHRANIFSLKWAPFLPSRLMTAAGDDQVCTLFISCLLFLTILHLIGQNIRSKRFIFFTNLFRKSNLDTL